MLEFMEAMAIFDLVEHCADPRAKPRAKYSNFHTPKMIAWSQFLCWPITLLTAGNFIANLEMLLHVNKVDLTSAPFRSSGQLIALMSGMLSFISVSWACLKVN